MLVTVVQTTWDDYLHTEVDDSHKREDATDQRGNTNRYVYLWLPHHCPQTAP